jgi:hypothetical protein
MQSQSKEKNYIETQEKCQTLLRSKSKICRILKGKSQLHNAQVNHEKKNETKNNSFCYCKGYKSDKLCSLFLVEFFFICQPMDKSI